MLDWDEDIPRLGWIEGGRKQLCCVEMGVGFSCIEGRKGLA